MVIPDSIADRGKTNPFADSDTQLEDLQEESMFPRNKASNWLFHIKCKVIKVYIFE